MEIEVKGHSGCIIDILRENKNLYIYKSTNDEKYSTRLKLQAIKQKNAFKLVHKNIRVPEIYSINEMSNLTSIKMEYIYSKNFVEFFESVGFDQINNFITSLIVFIEEELKKSPIQLLDNSIFINKFNDVVSKIRINNCVGNNKDVHNILKRSSVIFNKLSTIKLPIGFCHGDLTFSNILFSGSNYYLIDFLDSFVESPLMDIVKLRQDSAYMWSKLMYVGNIDSIRMKIVCDKIDFELDEYFKKYDWYKDYYIELQLMNFLRILQYAKEDRVIDYLINTINRIINEY